MPKIDADRPAGLELRLRDADAARTSRQAPRQARADELPRRRVEAILERLPPLPREALDQRELALPTASLPAPRPGRTVRSTFPPPPSDATRPEPATEPLEVLAHAPEGEVRIAGNLSVTFSQPMSAVGPGRASEAETQPVRLDPEPPGSWRWLGTRTLLFEPEGRFPMATRYSVEVPAGTRSATGGALERAVGWRFETPPPELRATHPSGESVPLRPVLVLGFDQRVSAKAMRDAIRVTADGREVDVRLAREADLAADADARRLVESLPEDRFVALVPSRSLPRDAAVKVTVPAGAPSAEGPLRTETDQGFELRTYGPLRVTEHRCGWSRDACPPGQPFRIEFSNPLEPLESEGLVRVSPEIPRMRVDVEGRHLTIQGATRPRTTYRVELDARIRDGFGQELGEDRVLTFETGPAPQRLTAGGGTLVVLDPAGRPELPVYSAGFESLLVVVHAVEPSDWEGFLDYRRKFRGRSRPSVPGRQVFVRSIEVKGDPDDLVETPIDLAPALEDGLGHALVVIEPDRLPAGARHRPALQVWVQATRIGLDAFVDTGELLAWASSLEDGAPLRDVELSLEPGGARGGSDARGLRRLSLPAKRPEGPSLLVARRGRDVALLPERLWVGGGSWHARPPRDRLLWHVLDDRGLYRPGETARVKGWLRRLEGGASGDLELPAEAGTVAWMLMDPRGEELSRGRAKLTALGGFDLELELPEEANLGRASLQLKASAGDLSGAHVHGLRVEEFRRPEYEVSIETDEGPHFASGATDLTATAQYYAGGGLPQAEVVWTVRRRTSQYRPPGWDRFHFGRWHPFWRHWPGAEREEEPLRHEGRTDAAGRHRLHLEFGPVEPPLPTSLSAEATVEDVNRQAWTAKASLLVHPGEVYAGLRVERGFVDEGQPIEVEVVAVDLDGRPVAGRDIVVTAERTDWRRVDGRWQEVFEDAQECRLQSALEPVTCTIRPGDGGQHRIRVQVADSEGRPSLSELRVWVSGGRARPNRSLEQDRVELVPERETYQPGDTARLLVQAPFHPAEGLLTLRREGLVEERRFSMASASEILEVEIRPGHVPNVHVQVNLNGAAPRDGGGERPAFASGSVDLKVPPLARALEVSALPREASLEPGGETHVDVSVRDASGQPVAGAEVAVLVVDEAVLALTGYELLDPLATFHPRRGAGVRDHHLRRFLLLAEPEIETDQGQPSLQEMPMEAMRGAPKQARAMAAPAMLDAEAGGGAGGPAEMIALRTDFDALALFAPELPTDVAGNARVRVKLPDNLTRYRVMAVAVDGTRRFGKAESTLTARLPVMVRPSPPRFLSLGDELELPVVVQNQTDAEREVELALRASNLRLPGSAGRRLRVPAGDRVEVRFPARTDRPGLARLQVGLVSEAFSDAAELSFPVHTPATTEAFATYGFLDSGADLVPIAVPQDSFDSFGGLEVGTSSTALQGLTDAVIYLAAYPFACAEQLASRILAVAALRDVLGAFEAEGLPPEAELAAAVERDLEALVRRQNADGGFGFWTHGERSQPFVTLHVSHALERARLEGLEVPEPLREGALQYVRRIESHLPKSWGSRIRATARAHALHLLRLAGEPDPKRARALLDEHEIDELPLEALGWILPTLAEARDRGADSILRHLRNRATESAATAQFTTSYGEDAYLIFHSNRRTDAVLLDALLETVPDEPLLPKLARGLLAHRVRGRWTSTQENAWVLVALDRYFETFEKEEPDFTARAWLGEVLAVEQEFRGRSTDRHLVEVPMAELASGAPTRDLVLAKEGPGRLYYRLGMRHAPRDLVLEAAERGFVVERRYEAVDHPGDVRRDAGGAWRLRAGATVRVRLDLVAPQRRYHVALVDPLPAALEPLNPALAVTARPPNTPGEPTPLWWRPVWYQHQNLRDERAEAFTTLLRPGAYSYSYLARATTPGRFVAAPAKAEEMYFPETFGRTSTDVVIVE